MIIVSLSFYYCTDFEYSLICKVRTRGKKFQNTNVKTQYMLEKSYIHQKKMYD